MRMVYNFVDTVKMFWQSLAYQSFPFLSIVKDWGGKVGERVAGKINSALLALQPIVIRNYNLLQQVLYELTSVQHSWSH